MTIKRNQISLGHTDRAKAEINISKAGAVWWQNTGPLTASSWFCTMKRELLTVLQAQLLRQYSLGQKARLSEHSLFTAETRAAKRQPNCSAAGTRWIPREEKQKVPKIRSGMTKSLGWRMSQFHILGAGDTLKGDTQKSSSEDAGGKRNFKAKGFCFPAWCRPSGWCANTIVPPFSVVTQPKNLSGFLKH